MNYVVITENDVSQWKDNTGREYHFPKRYLKYLTKGTVIVYYKGRMKDASFALKRMTRDPHYFGIAEIGEVKQDIDSEKNDYYAEIINFKPFSYPVLAKKSGQFIEKIPTSRLKNYWRDGVRPVPRHDPAARDDGLARGVSRAHRASDRVRPAPARGGGRPGRLAVAALLGYRDADPAAGHLRRRHLRLPAVVQRVAALAVPARN